MPRHRSLIKSGIRIINRCGQWRSVNAKQAAFLAAVAMAFAGLIAAAALQDGTGEGDGRVTVVASFYPLGYMAESIGGDRVEVLTLVPANQEVHGWQPSTSDILAAGRAEVLLYNGAGLDPWFEDDILASVGDDGRVVVRTTDGLDLLPADDDHDHGGHDPHTWLSPRAARHQARAVYEALVEADPGSGDAYLVGWEALDERLGELDSSYRAVMANATSRTLVVSHEAYGYIAGDYGLEQRGAIGISADEQPSAAAIADLVELMSSEGILSVYVDPVLSDDYARTLEREVEEATGEDVSVLRLYVLTGPVDGRDLMEQMEANLRNLERGLLASG